MREKENERIQQDDFSLDELVQRLKRPELGAIVTFLGVVRADPGVTGITVEIYREMAAAELRKLEQEAREKFEIDAVEIVHREGPLKVGENIVAIIVGARHRRDAFRACEYLINELKKRVPIWKQGE